VQIVAQNKVINENSLLGKSFVQVDFKHCLDDLILPFIKSSAILDHSKIRKRINTSKMLESHDSKQLTNIEKLQLMSVVFLILVILLLCIGYVLIKKQHKLIRAKKEAETALQSKTDFLSVISHELRTPLHAVIGITGLLINEQPREDQMDYLRNLKFSSDHLMALINDVLEINKMDANKAEIAQLSFDLKQLVTNLIEALSLSKMKNGNTLHLNLDKAIPKYLIGDELKISQVLFNLIGNALKFTKNGNVWVKISTVKSTETSMSLHFSVKDDGIGVSRARQKQIFEDFTQESMLVSKQYGGTGLGLSIVKKILRLMGSDIKIKSKKNKGATFYFDLSLDKDSSFNLSEAKEKESFKALNGLKALIVDDDTINQLLIQKILEDKQVDCTICSSGLEAIHQLKTMEFDIVFMDINMPNMNGYQTAMHIRGFNATIPIIALTAVKSDEICERVMSSGINDYIFKPFVHEEFYQKIKNVL